MAISKIQRRNKEALEPPTWFRGAGKKTTKDLIVDFVKLRQNGATGKEIHNSLPGLSQRTIQQACKELLISQRISCTPCRCGTVNIFIRK